MVTVPADYDPEYWDEQSDRVIADYAGKPITPELIEEMERRLAPIRDGRWQAAHAAFPWVEVWFEDTDKERFVAEIQARMTDDDAQVVRHLKADENYSWRSIAGWSYTERRQVWLLGWTMPEHQEVGMAVCEAAARRLGEDPHTYPW